MFSRSILWCSLAVLVFSFVGASTAQVTVTPGQANLEIKLTNAAPEILAYLNAHPVETTWWEESALPVRLYPIGEDVAAAMATYEVSTTQPDPLATKVVMPDVPPTGTTFQVEIDALYLDGGAQYRVGSANPSAPAKIMCGPVMRLADDADGLDCGVSECAALFNLTLSLTGIAADLDALDDTVPVACSAEGSVEELSWSGHFVRQANSAGAAFDVSDLRTAAAVLPILVRGDGSRIHVSVSCMATVKEGEGGFVLLPGSRHTPLSATAVVTPSCDGVNGVDMPMDVERTAGVLQGLFDIGGRTETAAEVWFDHRGVRFSVEPAVAPAISEPDPADPWIFEGAPSTTPTSRHDVGARALVDEGYRYLELPHRRGLNGRVDVPTGFVTDLGSTFVSLPQSLPGMVILDDRTAGFGLGHLNTGPLTNLSRYHWHSSFISAEGRAELANGGKSGDQGLSRSALQGGYDASEGKSELSYELLLAGLSDDNGPLNGRGAAPTPWLIEDLNFYFEDPIVATSQQLTTRIGVLLPRTTNAYPATGNPSPLEPVPDLHLCLGKVSLTLRSDPALAMLFKPRLMTSYDGSILTIPGDPYSLFEWLSADSKGAPATIQDRADEATVSLLLPAGARYWVQPSVSIAPPDGSTSNKVWLSGIEMPMGGDLQCGSETDTCGTVDEAGEITMLAIVVEPPVDDCPETGELVFDVTVQASAPVVSLTLKIDSQPEQMLCGPCPLVDGVTQPYPVTANIPADDDYHTLLLTAEDDLGCIATHEMTVYVPSQELTLQRAPDFTCRVAAADIPLAGDHCCIEDNLTDPLVVGGCNYPTQIFDNRPATFAEGSTDVTFVASPSGAECTTTVTVESLPEYQLAYAEGDQVKIREVGTGLYQLNQIAPAEARWLEFDPDGGRLAAALGRSNPAVQVFDVDNDALLYPIASLAGGHNVQFRPTHPSDLAVLLRAPATTTYSLGIFQNGAEQTITPIAEAPFMSLPEIAWDREGERLEAIVAEPHTDADGIPIQGYDIRLYDWSVTSTGLGSHSEWVGTRYHDPREEPFKLLYANLPGTGLFASNRGLSIVGATNLFFLTEVPNDHMDLAIETGLTVFVTTVQSGVKVAVITLPTTIPPVIDEGPTFPVTAKVKPRVEVSDDGKRIAVSLGDRIEIVEYPGFTPIGTFVAADVQHMRFRPRDSDNNECEAVGAGADSGFDGLSIDVGAWRQLNEVR